MTQLNYNVDRRMEVYSTQARAMKTDRSNKLPGPSDGDVSMVDAEPSSDKSTKYVEKKEIQWMDQGPKNRPLTS